MTPPRVLTVAGSDPSGGAGIAQDLRTFHAFGAWGMAAITAVTFQNTTGVLGWHAVPPEDVRAQIDAVAADIGVDAAKTGMIPDARTAHAVAKAFDAHGIENLIVDPVLSASTGAQLGADDVVFALRELLLPRALLVTPNVDEAFALTGIEIEERGAQIAAARALVALGARNALVTGGHLDATDVLVASDGRVHEFPGARLESENTHGTGCVLSAAIAAEVARGEGLVDAIERAKAFVTAAIESGVDVGNGPGAVNPGARAQHRAE